MVHHVRRIGVTRMATVLGALYLLLGVVFAAIFAVIGAMVPTPGDSMFRGGFLIAMPLLYGVLGFVFGAVTAWLYNVIAGWTGGLELDLESAEPGRSGLV